MGVAGYLLLLFGVASIIFFFLPDRHPLRSVLTQKIPDFILYQVVGRLFGQRGTNGVKQFVHYILWEPNPVLQVVYLILISGGFFVGVTEAFRFAPNPYVPAYHKFVCSC